MNATSILNGLNGFSAKGFASSVVLNQLAFDANRSLQKAKENTETLFDASTQADLAETFGDSGVPVAQKLDTDALIYGHAAAYILLRRVIGENDPETGRKPEHLIKRLVSLPDAIVAAVGRMTNYNLQQGKAEAAKLGADFTNREAAIRGEMDAEAARQMAEIKGPWITAIRELKDADTEFLVDACLEAMVNAGRSPTLELRRAADMLRDAMKKRVEAGGFARLDTGIYAMCTSAPDKPVNKPAVDPANDDIVDTMVPATA